MNIIITGDDTLVVAFTLHEVTDRTQKETVMTEAPAPCVYPQTLQKQTEPQSGESLQKVYPPAHAIFSNHSFCDQTKQRFSFLGEVP